MFPHLNFGLNLYLDLNLYSDLNLYLDLIVQASYVYTARIQSDLLRSSNSEKYFLKFRLFERLPL